MKHRGMKILSLLLTLVMVLGMMPGMTAYADDTYTVTVTYDSTTILTMDDYELGLYLNIYGTQFSTVFTSFETVSGTGIVANPTLWPTKTAFSFEVSGAGNGTISGGYNTMYGSPSFDLHVTCVKNVPAGYTVTYSPGEGSYAGGDLPTGKAVKGADDKFTYKIEGYDKDFTPPEEGMTFKHWVDDKGHTYKTGDTITVTEDITLTAVWEKKSQESGTQPQRRGGGLSGDLVFFGGSGVDNSWEYIGGGMPQRAYRVSLAPMQGGSAALGLTTGESGAALNVYPTTTVYVFPNAEPGYTLDKIVWSLIDGSASYDITEAKNFVMPAMDVVVYVTFRPVG